MSSGNRIRWTYYLWYFCLLLQHYFCPLISRYIAVLLNLFMRVFIQVDVFFDRVLGCSLLETEIQTEVRGLAVYPNTLMLTRPISVTRSSRTIIFTTLSLGYDIHYPKVDCLLIQAVVERPTIRNSLYA